MLLFEKDKNICKKRLTKPSLSDKIHHVPNGTYALVAQLDRVTDYESVGRGFESLPSHQEKPVHIVYWFFFFVCAVEGARTGRRRIAPQAISPVGCCLARGFQRVGMSTVEAVNRKISWLFCFVSHGCTVSAWSGCLQVDFALCYNFSAKIYRAGSICRSYREVCFMNTTLRRDADEIICSSIQAVLPDKAVCRAL